MEPLFPIDLQCSETAADLIDSVRSSYAAINTSGGTVLNSYLQSYQGVDNSPL